jgi:hypothetical protein
MMAAMMTPKITATVKTVKISAHQAQTSPPYHIII